jgi:hypothetical protein
MDVVTAVPIWLATSRFVHTAPRHLMYLSSYVVKTVTFSHMIAKRLKGSIVLVHHDELIRQTQAKMRFVVPELRTCSVKAGGSGLGWLMAE